MKGKLRQMAYCILLLLGMTLLGGCSIERTNRTKVRDLEYHVVTEEEIPEELKGQIAEKKSADFKMTFETPEHLYIIRGYGIQETGGFSIQVKEIYLSSNAIFFFNGTDWSKKRGNDCKKSELSIYCDTNRKIRL